MKALRYRVELEERVLAAGREGDPNTVVTQPFLPGSLLRGALIGQYLDGNGREGAPDLAADEPTRGLFFDGQTRYLNGYLVDDGSARPRRMLPTPRSWHRKKDQRRKVWDFAAGEPADALWAQPFQTLREPFCAMPPPPGDRRPGDRRPEGVWLDAPDRVLKTHIQRAAGAGRPTEERGAIYRYESLAAGQTFEAFVLCDEAEQAGRLLEAVGEEKWRDGELRLRLGKARSVQGAARAKLLDVWDAGERGWWNEESEAREALDLEERYRPAGPASRPSENASGEVLVVTLLSSALARDAQGQFAAGPGPLTAALNRALEATGSDGTGGGREAIFDAPQHAYLSASHAGGFNRTWGLHLREADAIARGSVLVYPRPAGLSASDLRALEWRGIGARRAEGFGRVAFNLHGGHETLRAKPETEQRAPGARNRPREVPSDTPAHALASDMAERMLRQQLDLALTRAAAGHSVGGTGVPRSQIGGLRALLRRALKMPSAKGRDLLREYIKDVRSRQAARSRFEGVHVERAGNATPLLTWVRERVEDGSDPSTDASRASLWDLLLPARGRRPAVGTVQAGLTGELVYVYNLRLAHDVLEQAGGDT